jgi:serine protease
MRSLLAVLLLLAGTMTARGEEVPGRFVVRWKDGRPVHPTRVAGRSVVRARHLGNDSWSYHLEERSVAAAREAIEELRRRGGPELLEVVPVHSRQLFALPNDELVPAQWSLGAIHMEQAWQRMASHTDSPFKRDPREIVVAIVDSGIAAQHPDLDRLRIVPGWNFISDATATGDGGSRDSDPYEPKAGIFHGTHVAGIIGATSGNGIGVAGLNPYCRILPVRVVGVDDSISDDDLAAGIRWAAGYRVEGAADNEHPAHVINLSLGGKLPENSALKNAIDDAIRHGVLVVAAAGNGHESVKNYFPAAHPGVITVGGIASSGQRDESYSNYGDQIAIMAPGTAIVSAFEPSFVDPAIKVAGYKSDSGTSMAAPHVSAVLALMVAAHPGLLLGEARDLLEQTADHSGMCKEGCGAGLLDADLALKAAAGLAFDNSSRTPSDVRPFSVEGGCSVGPAAATRAPAALAPLLLAVLCLLACRRRR